MTTWRVYDKHANQIATIESYNVSVRSGALVFYRTYESQPQDIIAPGVWQWVESDNK